MKNCTWRGFCVFLSFSVFFFFLFFIRDDIVICKFQNVSIWYFKGYFVQFLRYIQLTFNLSWQCTKKISYEKVCFLRDTDTCMTSKDLPNDKLTSDRIMLNISRGCLLSDRPLLFFIWEKLLLYLPPIFYCLEKWIYHCIHSGKHTCTMFWQLGGIVVMIPACCIEGLKFYPSWW